MLADNGRAALAILAQDRAFDGVLMDVQMPELDGYETTRLLRADPAFRDIPVLAMTANAMSGDRERAIASGMNDHIPKPLDVARMFQTMAEWIHPRSRVRTPSAPPPVAIPPQVLAEIDIPGLDVRAALSLVMGKERLLRRQLARFRDSYAGFRDAFVRALADPDPRTARRAAHTLKGLAGSIGAGAVQAAAVELERACARSPRELAPVEAALDATVAALAPVLAGIARLPPVGDSSSGAPVVALDVAGLRARLAELAALLERSDARAGELADDIARQLRATDHVAAFERVQRAVAAYDFDAALALVRAFAARLPGTTEVAQP